MMCTRVDMGSPRDDPTCVDFLAACCENALEHTASLQRGSKLIKLTGLLTVSRIVLDYLLRAKITSLL